jgi:hypothetical protein
MSIKSRLVATYSQGFPGQTDLNLESRDKRRWKMKFQKMTIESRNRPRHNYPYLSFRIGRGLFLAAVLLLLPAATLASDVSVNCDGGPADFPSITAALNVLDLIGPHSISITGTCVENLTIFQRARLTLFSAPGTNATLRSANTAPNVVIVSSSRRIRFSGLVFEGGGGGMRVDGGSEVFLENCTIQNNDNNGVVVASHSLLSLSGTAIQNNGLDGLQINGNSMAFAGNTTPAGFVRISGNRGNGVAVNQSNVQILGLLAVEDNGGAAILSRGGRLVFAGTSGEHVYRNNRLGISISGGTADFFGRHTIQNNGLFGVQVFGGASVNFNSATLPGGSLGFTLIEGHSNVGMNILRLGEVNLNGPHLIRGNGSASADPTFRGGIRVSRATLTAVGGAQVTGNFGPGILLEFNSSLSTTSVSITGNSEEGVRVLRQSVAGLSGPHTIAGNGMFSLTCDVTSLIFGNLDGTAPINCHRVEREFGPPRPGDIN